jgi:hypothetical protein
MTPLRVALRLFPILIALLNGSAAWAQYYPVPRVREEAESLDAASRLADAGRWEEAAEAFEAASRDGAVLTAPALRRWGIAASEASRPLTAYVRLRQYLAMDREPADRDNLSERVSRAREALLASAAQFSRVLAALERQPEGAAPGERHIVRVAAREAEVSLEGMSGLQVEAPLWRRAEEIAIGPYLDLVRRLLDSPDFLEDTPVQLWDPSDPGPRRMAVLRVVIGDEERRIEAVRGEPYEHLKAAAAIVVDFARRVPALVDPDPKPAPPPTKVRKKRR